MTTQTAAPSALTLSAAAAAAGVLPAAGELTSSPAVPGEAPAADAVAVVAGFTGSTSGTVGVVVDASLVVALEGSPLGALDVADAVRPALEAAVAAVGPAVLDAPRTTTAAELLSDADVELVPLRAATGVAGWLGLRVRPVSLGAVPGQRGSLASHGLDLLGDVEMAVTVEIGRTRMTVKELLQLTPGAVVELDRAAGSPADLLVNGRLIARGEIVVVDEDYGIRVTEIVPGATERR